MGASQVVTCRGPARARRGTEMADLEVIDRGAVLVGDDGRVAAVGPEPDVRRSAAGATVERVDGVLFPGFVDSHTHAVFATARLADHEHRARGEDYKTIAAKGGGILSSVTDLRRWGRDDLADVTHRRLQVLLRHGTTTVEVKSGYGLDPEHELQTLEVAAGLAGGAPDVIPTFLGAHEVPPEYRGRSDEYLDLVIDEMIPTVARRRAARFCDVFCEPGVFTIEQSRRVLEAGKRQGLRPKLHADELEGTGGAELAVAMGAVSADHLAAVSERGIAELARTDTTVAVLLPGTMLFLGRKQQAPARRLIDAGAAVALATDFNPGSSPGLSLPLMMTMGVSQMGMLPAETVIACTVNGAAAVGEAARRGQIAPGFRADLCLATIRDWRELPYWYGVNLVSRVWVAGHACHSPEGAVIYLV